MAEKKRVPQKKGQATAKAAAELEKKRTDFYCCRCGKQFSRQNNNFPVTRSDIYRGNNGYLPFCKNCVNEMYLHYFENTEDPYFSVKRICLFLDLYYEQNILDNVLSGTPPHAVMTTYIGRIANSEFREYSYDDNIIEGEEELKKEQEEICEDTEMLIKKGRNTWGLDLPVEDYEYLDNEFADWNNRCSIDGKTRESLVREICVLKLQQNKALSDNDIDTYNKLSQTFQKTLSTAELTPKQQAEMKKTSEKPLGVMIKMFEDERPVPEPLDEWRDVDGILKIIRVFFIGHLCKMLGLRNKYSQEYEETMNEFAAITPEDMIFDDSEDVYDYLLEHGFSDIDGLEEDDENEETV